MHYDVLCTKTHKQTHTHTCASWNSKTGSFPRSQIKLKWSEKYTLPVQSSHYIHINSTSVTAEETPVITAVCQQNLRSRQLTPCPAPPRPPNANYSSTMEKFEVHQTAYSFKRRGKKRNGFTDGQVGTCCSSGLNHRQAAKGKWRRQTSRDVWAESRWQPESLTFSKGHRFAGWDVKHGSSCSTHHFKKKINRYTWKIEKSRFLWLIWNIFLMTWK